MRAPARPERWIRTGAVAVFAAYVAFVFVPIALRLSAGAGFGADPTQYLLASQDGVLTSTASLHYPFPLLPFLYLPLAHSGLSFVTIYEVADLVSGAVMVGLFLASAALGYAIGRSIAAAAGAGLMVGTFSLLVSEVGWGGQAQLLSFALGTLALAILLGIRTPAPTPDARWIAGALLGAAVLAEAYSGAYFVICAVLIAILLDGRTVLARRTALSYAALIALPAAAYALVWASGGAAIYHGAGTPVLPYALRPSAWNTALSENGFGSPVNLYGYAALVVALFVFALWARRFERREVAALVGTLGACLIQAFILTPAIYWDRGPFFVAIPLAAIVAVLLGELARLLARPDRSVAAPPPRRFARRGGDAAWRRGVVVGTAVVAVAVIVGQSAVAVELYPPALSYYAEPLTGLSELTWLRGETGAVLVATPLGEMFPVGYATDRPEFPTVQPYWFDTPDGRANALLADTLLASGSWISNGNFELAETGAPAGAASPSVVSEQSPYFVDLATVFEEQGGELSAKFVGGAAPREASNNSTDAPSLLLSDRLPGYTVSTDSWFAANDTIDVNLTFVALGPKMTTVGVGVTFPQATFSSYATHGARTSIALGFSQSGSVRAQYALNATAAATPGIALGSPAETTQGGVVSLTWNATPTFGYSASQFNVSLTFGATGFAPTDPALYTEADVLTAHDIRWVVVSTSMSSADLARFADDPAFELARSGPCFDVYEVR